MWQSGQKLYLIIRLYTNLTHERTKQSCSPYASITKPHAAAAWTTTCSGYHANTGIVTLKTGNAIFLCPNHVISLHTSHLRATCAEFLDRAALRQVFLRVPGVFHPQYHSTTAPYSYFFNYRQTRLNCASDTKPCV